MTRRRLGLWAAGALVTGSVVYALTRPAPVPAPALPIASAPQPAPAPGPIEPIEPPSSAADSEPAVSAQPAIASATLPASSASGSTRKQSGVCERGMSDAEWRIAVSVQPSILQLPEERQRRMRRGSERCPCLGDSDAFKCIWWCEPLGYPGGKCDHGTCVCTR